jgi:hypothetical protein
MQKLKVQGKLLLGLLVAMSSAMPLACGDDDSKGTGTVNDAGASGSSETAGGGSSGSSAHGGGAGASGGAQGGEAGVAEGGADMGGADMGGSAGMIDHGTTGEAGTAGDAPVVVDQAAQYQAHIDAICTVEGGLDCSDSETPAEEKQACYDGFAGLLDYAPNCVPQIRAFVACLAPFPAAGYMCDSGAAYAKDSSCPDEAATMFACFPQ